MQNFGPLGQKVEKFGENVDNFGETQRLVMHACSVRMMVKQATTSQNLEAMKSPFLAVWRNLGSGDEPRQRYGKPRNCRCHMEIRRH